jgi:hypothetical protein
MHGVLSVDAHRDVDAACFSKFLAAGSCHGIWPVSSPDLVQAVRIAALASHRCSCTSS